MKDIAPELLAAIEKDFAAAYAKSDTIKKIMALVAAGKGNYSDAHAFAIEVGEILSSSLRAHLTADVLPDGRLFYNIANRILPPTMGESYTLIAAETAAIQTNLNAAAGIGIKGIEAELNEDRIAGIVNKISAAEKFEEVAWLLYEPMVNFCQSIVDDTAKKNAEFHLKSGLAPKIIRRSTGKCCAWCDKLAGVYDYRDVRSTGNDVFRRHERCRCTVEYVPADGKRQNVWSKKPVFENENRELLERKILGRTYAGIKVTSVAPHVVDRMVERNIEPEDIIAISEKPLAKKPVKIDKEGRPSLQIIGERATIAVNPDTGKMTTAWPTHSDTASKYRNLGKEGKK